MYRFIIYLVSLLLLPAAVFAQNPEWMKFISGANVYTIVDDGGYLWAGGEGLTRLNKATSEMIFYNEANSGLPNDIVYALAIDAQRNTWIGTWGGGLAKFDGANWMVYTTGNSGLPTNYVQVLAIDAEGNKWIGSNPIGLTKFDGVAWRVYYTDNSGLPINWVRALAIDAQGNKWIGTWGGGLAKFDGANWTRYNTGNSGLPDNLVYALAIDAQENTWIGTDGGLAKFDGATWTVYHTGNSELPNNIVYALVIDAQGNKWIGTWGGGLAVYREGGVILTGMEERRSAEVPSVFSLSQNYPNPFNSSTTIRYEVAKTSHVTLKVYNLLGQEVALLVNEQKSPGSYEVRFDVGDLASGVYFYRLWAGKFVETKRLVLLK